MKTKQLKLEGNYQVFWRIRQRKANSGKYLTEEHKQHLRDSSPHLSGEKNPMYGRTGKNHPLYGIHPSDVSRQKMSDNHADVSGENHPNYGKRGEETSMFGRYHNETSKQLMSDNHADVSGENHPMYGKTGELAPMYGMTGEKNGMYGVHRYGKDAPNYKGGISFLPYCKKFDDDLKERVRDFFDRKCYVCGKTEQEQVEEMISNGKRPLKKLDVHHVNYDKMVCCNDVKPLFVPLCRSCHAKTHSDREYWEEFFTASLEYLTGGQCFLPKENGELKEIGGVL